MQTKKKQINYYYNYFKVETNVLSKGIKSYRWKCDTMHNCGEQNYAKRFLNSARKSKIIIVMQQYLLVVCTKQLYNLIRTHLMQKRNTTHILEGLEQ